MRKKAHRLAPIFIVMVVFVLGALAAGILPSSASQKASPLERYEYRVVKEQPVGQRVDPSRTRDPFQPLEPPEDLEEFLNKVGRDGWEVDALRIRVAQSELKAGRKAPGYYVYSYAGEGGPKFLRLRRRVR